MADLSETVDFFNWLKGTHPEIHLLRWQEEFVGMYFKNKSREEWDKHLLSMPIAMGKTFLKNLIQEFEKRK